MRKVGVLLLNMGGPDSLEAVQPFLYNLFSDHDIIAIPRLIQKPVAWIISHVRAKKTMTYYRYMGGKSPQKEQTLEQAQKLQEVLGDGFLVKVGMRYWHPFIEEALQEMESYPLSGLILLPMYPQYSRTTTGSSFNEFDRVFPKSQMSFLPVVKIQHYYDHPLYIQAMVENIKENLPNWQDYFFLFSAHSLPISVIKKGDPYQFQTERTVQLIMQHFPGVNYALAYQSKVGPVKWLQPETEKVLEDVIKRGVKKVAVIPVSFVNEHSETLYELDYQYGNMARSLGVEDYVRIPTLRTHPTFVRCLADLVLSHALQHQLIGN
ncbi:ferrochelatase [Thermocrinis albus DSM 14484]|uniref:Ferrochelatase n=1 Tax=Thermocrinis albus (strain DSM 14484 / JCM 11386 / HI 11/12) TaxID=638303 RepID=D3SLH6_THEAH|nr:ferrochelatase [Thermocrinis albus]ADC89606.1 ferrochelatase [Thermocrinis albus DSM 14484]